jgi:hypothetical protein
MEVMELKQQIDESVRKRVKDLIQSIGYFNTLQQEKEDESVTNHLISCITEQVLEEFDTNEYSVFAYTWRLVSNEIATYRTWIKKVIPEITPEQQPVDKVRINTIPGYEDVKDYYWLTRDGRVLSKFDKEIGSLVTTSAGVLKLATLTRTDGTTLKKCGKELVPLAFSEEK